MLARTDSRTRAVVLLLITSLLVSIIGARLVWWQVIERDRLTAMALDQMARDEAIPAERGEILDANGVVLATSIELKSVYATPPFVADPDEAAAALAPILDKPVSRLAQLLRRDDAFLYLARRVSPEASDAVRSLGLRGIGLLPETQRVYPVAGHAEGTTIASHVLGFVSMDGDGQYGVEWAEDALLGGTDGALTAMEDVAGRRIADSVYELSAPVDGSTLQLTLDAALQHLLEREIHETYETNRAIGATGIVMDVHTGAILAMASAPSFDANAFASVDPERYDNPAVARAYEPGSVMKVFTVAAAIDAGAISLADTFVDDNNLQVGGVTISNADRWEFPSGHGPITARDVLRLSNNVGAAKIGLALGGAGLYEAFRRYGFGAPTGIELSGEATGVVWDPNGPNGAGELTTAQNAFGQGLSVTAVQMAAGYAAIANGGTLVQPHLVAAWIDESGERHPIERAPGERVMSERTSQTVVRLMTDAIDDGIASGASIPGYSVAGKTGTAQIAGPVEMEIPDGFDENGEPKTTTVEQILYVDGWIDASFIGIVPAREPRLVTLILTHRPVIWGLYQMQERPEIVFRDLAPTMLDYLAIPPDRPVESAIGP